MGKLSLSYNVHNYMEEVVTRALHKLLAEKPRVCPCSKCMNDMLSKALNGIKPNYTNPRLAKTRLEDLDSHLFIQVMTVTYDAINKIGDNPRHTLEGVDSPQLALHNYSEDLFANVMQEVLRAREDVCTCSQCMDLIAATSLEQMSAKYTSSYKGQAYVRLAELDRQFLSSTLSIIYHAIERAKREIKH